MPRTTPLPFVDYTSREFLSIRASLLSYIQQRFPDDFTDFSEGNLGVVLLELVAYAVDVLNFTLDRQVNELYLGTARDRDSVVKIAAMLGYKLSPSTASSVRIFLDATELSKFVGTIVIDAGTSISVPGNDGNIPFETPIAYSILRIANTTPPQWSVNGSAATLNPEISFVQGETVSDTFSGDGSLFQQYRGSRGPSIDNTYEVKVDGVAWTLVESLVLRDINNPDNIQLYEVLLDSEDLPSIRFGDGINGSAPTQGSQIKLTYRIGGGSIGNVAAGAVSTTVTALRDGVEQVTLKIANLIRASGGTDRESIEHAKLFAPQWARTTDRVVTQADYEAVCNGYTDGATGAIARAGVIAGPRDGLANVVTIYVWALDGAGLGLASSALKNSLLSFLEKRRSLCVKINPIQDGEFIDIDVDVLVDVLPDADEISSIAAVRKSITDLFFSSEVMYGGELRTSWIYDVVVATNGVRSAHVRAPDIELEAGKIDTLGTGVLPTQPSGPGTANQITILTPISRPLNYFCNYYITVGNQTKRVVQSTVTASGRSTCTMDSDWGPPLSSGLNYDLSHPRRLRLDHNPAADPTNRRFLVRGVPGAFGSYDIEAAVIEYDTTELIVVLDHDLEAGAVNIGQEWVLTSDYKAIASRAIRLGTLNVEAE